MAGFRVKVEADEGVKELFLQNGTNGDVDLMLEGGDDGWFIVTINADGTLTLHENVGEGEGVQVDKDGKIVIRE